MINKVKMVLNGGKLTFSRLDVDCIRDDILDLHGLEGLRRRADRPLSSVSRRSGLQVERVITGRSSGETETVAVEEEEERDTERRALTHSHREEREPRRE